ncbi:hypothetical protein PsorP6_017232 [Peronosclerospora sorghi]|uniref:Uncharacterized protein n=1 Tax=Peronosclerospora sorghi TaxID=230839 RepID=A0ACC0WL04_9STRA|nr:hypothetical protein PsorP6_017232 [Peronosclerospora sorghi]
MTAKIKSKQSALGRLDQDSPCSVKTNISLSVSKELDEAGKADPLRNKFSDQLTDNEAKLTAIIKETTKHELELLKTKLDALYDSAVEEISSFYGEVHTSLTPSRIPWEEALASINVVHSMALTDFLQAKGSLNQRLMQLRYDLAVEAVVRERAKAAKEAKRATAMDIEASIPTAQSVQELVDARLKKELGQLKKQVTQLMEALRNDSAGRRGAPTSAKKTANPQEQKRPPNAIACTVCKHCRRRWGCCR